MFISICLLKNHHVLSAWFHEGCWFEIVYFCTASPNGPPAALEKYVELKLSGFTKLHLPIHYFVSSICKTLVNLLLQPETCTDALHCQVIWWRWSCKFRNYTNFQKILVSATWHRFLSDWRLNFHYSKETRNLVTKWRFTSLQVKGSCFTCSFFCLSCF